MPEWSIMGPSLALLLGADYRAAGQGESLQTAPKTTIK
jgi:hypothetical protein